ncbi:Tat pathway signal sequence [Colletotrichum sp. SAR 10_99]|nr:Tat pathway signal sequence [Colletotrichum sp. SAR 10_99]
MPSTEYHQLSTSRDEDLDDISFTHQDQYVTSKKKALPIRVLGVLVAFLGLVSYTAAVLYYAQEFIHKPYCPRFAASDTVHLWDKIGYKPMHFNPATPHHSDAFLGSPSAELDANWRKLLLTFSSRLPDSEADRLGPNSDAIPFDDGKGGFVGGIAVVHNLHCINYVYQTMHGDYYFPNITEKQLKKQKSHLSHCLHHLMSSAKCQADMTPVLLHWTADDHVPVLKWDGVQRSCVDWESLMNWGDEHSMTHSETMPSVSKMKHPIYSHFVDDRGRFILANAEGVVDFEEFSQRADYQQWAMEQGIGTGKEEAERFLEEFARKQNDHRH